jgi:hypothetical protein
MLLVRPQPTAGESRHGYLLRIAEANALDSPAGLTGDVLERSGLRARADLLRGPLAGLRALNAPDQGGLAMRYWNVRTCRYCPACLAERPSWRDVWQLVFYVACHHHRMALQQSCPACLQRVTWKRVGVASCRCGADLRRAKHESPNRAAVDASASVAAAWDGAPRVSAGTQGSVESILHRIWLLGAYQLALQPKAQKLSDLHLLPQATRVVEAAANVLDDWPRGFHALLDATAERYGVRTSARMTDRFGGLYKEIYNPARVNDLGDLRDGFERYVRERWSGQLAARNSRLSSETRDAHVWVPVTRAARDLHWRSGRVRSAIERGLLEGRLQCRPSGRVAGVVHRESLDLLKQDAQSWLDLGAVCRRLRKGKKAVRDLVAIGQLNAVSGPKIDGAAVWQFRAQDVEQLARRRGWSHTRE